MPGRDINSVNAIERIHASELEHHVTGEKYTNRADRMEKVIT